MRRRSTTLAIGLVGLVGAGAFLVAQGGSPPAAQGGRGGGRGGVQVQPGEPCPPGTTEVRPGRCSAPEFPPPGSVEDVRGRRFRQKPDQKPARKQSPRRRRDDVPDDDEY